MREQGDPVRRELVLMRHARAEAHGESDVARELAPRGYADARAAGRWLAANGFVPDGALVSAARRTASTWLAVAEGGSFRVEPRYSQSLYSAGPETALDLLRETTEAVTALVVVGHNPTMASLAQLLDDGSGDEQAGREMAVGFPAAAMARFALAGPWSELDLSGARLVGFHVGRG